MTVAERCRKIEDIKIVGNITPNTWYQTIVTETGKPDFIAIAILADIKNWYRLMPDGSPRFRSDIPASEGMAIQDHDNLVLRRIDGHSYDRTIRLRIPERRYMTNAGKTFYDFTLSYIKEHEQVLHVPKAPECCDQQQIREPIRRTQRMLHKKIRVVEPVGQSQRMIYKK